MFIRKCIQGNSDNNHNDHLFVYAWRFE
jgi:hypothetical protein